MNLPSRTTKIIVSIVVALVLVVALGLRWIDIAVSESYSYGWTAKSSSEAESEGRLAARLAVLTPDIELNGARYCVADAWIERAYRVDYVLLLYRRQILDDKYRLLVRLEPADTGAFEERLEQQLMGGDWLAYNDTLQFSVTSGDLWYTTVEPPFPAQIHLRARRPIAPRTSTSQAPVPVIGVLEQPPQCHDTLAAGIRPLFARANGEWTALSSREAWDALPSRPASFTLAIDGRSLGVVSGKDADLPRTEAGTFLREHLLTVAPGQQLPRLPDRKGRFTGWCSAPAVRPVVAVASGGFEDPSGWKPSRLASPVADTLLEAFRAAVGRASLCLSDTAAPVPYPSPYPTSSSMRRTATDEAGSSSRYGWTITATSAMVLRRRTAGCTGSRSIRHPSTSVLAWLWSMPETTTGTGGASWYSGTAAITRTGTSSCTTTPPAGLSSCGAITDRTDIHATRADPAADGGLPHVSWDPKRLIAREPLVSAGSAGLARRRERTWSTALHCASRPGQAYRSQAAEEPLHV